MDGDFEPISESDAERRIEQLQNLDTENQNIDVLKKGVNIRGFKNLGIPVDKGTNIYRARKLEEPPTHVSELSYPPKHLAVLNRANRDYNPIFYASSGAAAAVFELNPSPNEQVAILKWRTTEEITLNTIGYSPEVFNRLDSTRGSSDIPGDKTEYSESKGNAMLREYFAEIFTQQVPENEIHRHKLTVALAEMWLSGEMVDGIMYPTVRMWGNEDNLAIKTEVVDRILEPVSAEFIDIQGRGDKEIESGVIDTCTTIQDGELRWNGHGRQWKLEEDGVMGTFEFEDGRWQVKNPGETGVRVLHDQNFEY